MFLDPVTWIVSRVRYLMSLFAFHLQQRGKKIVRIPTSCLMNY